MDTKQKIFLSSLAYRKEKSKKLSFISIFSLAPYILSKYSN